MDELEEQKRLVNLKRLLELKSDLNYNIGSSKRQMTELDGFKVEEDISVNIGESYNNSMNLNVPKDIILKMIVENIESKESKLSELKEEIATEINHLAKGDKQ